MKKEIKISVRNLVEFVMRTGSIDTTKGSSIKPVEGTRAHQMIQRTYGDNYEAEYYLKYNFDYNDINITIEGRADGILKEDNKIIIDEIKTTLKNVYEYNENINPLHIAQAKCYGYIYCMLNNLDGIYIQLTYYNLDYGNMNKIIRYYSLGELENEFFNLIDEYKTWINMEREYQVERNKSIDNLEFPFNTYRKGQREFAVYVYKSILEGKKCFAQAPTGTGKTISTLFPAIKALGKNHTTKIFYLTARNATKDVCEKSILLMKNSNLNLKYTTISAKDKVCKKDETNCNPEYCEYAKGYYDRINEALKEILINESNYSKNNIDRLSDKYKLCPFELSLDLTVFSDIVICDYNYIFDPKVYLKRFLDSNNKEYTFLIDEAHNLVDRSRGMYSKLLCKSQFDSISKILKGKGRKLNYANNKIKSYFKNIDEELTTYKEINLLNHIESIEIDIELLSLLKSFVQKIDEYLEEINTENEELIDLYFEINSFLSIAEFYDNNFITIFEQSKSDIIVKINCIDPSKIIAKRLEKAKSTIIFSATLIPINYFNKMYNKQEEDYFISLNSPFNVNNRELIFANNINTTYNRRYETCDDIIEYIKNCVESKVGNYMVFFPSYSYMNLVYEKIKQIHKHMDIQVQTTDMSEANKEKFLDAFKENNKSTHVGFCVLGSHFSEGIDLTNNKLIGVIVIGVGMPQIGIERNLIKNHFDAKDYNGFDYAYTYPGMIKVLQAAGRCIRTSDDKGIIMLIDSRYSQSRYQKLFPKEWYPNKIARKSEDIRNICKNFWESMKEI